jgi:hypothetical protein
VTPRPAPVVARDVPLGVGPPVPLALRPFTAADILDGAFAVIRAAPAKVLTIAAVFAVPIQLVVAFLQRDLLGGVGLAELFTDPSSEAIAAAENDGTSGWATLVSLVGPSLVLPFVAAALAGLVAGWYGGRDSSLGEVLATVGRRWWALLASWALVHAFEAAAIVAFCVGPLFVMPLFVCVAPVIGIEGVGPVDAMRRSWRLARRRYWPTFGMALLTGFVASTLTQALSFAPQMLGLLIGLDVGWILLGMGAALASLLVMPMVAASSVLIYLDLRIRTEGLDLELDVQRLYGTST